MVSVLLIESMGSSLTSTLSVTLYNQRNHCQGCSRTSQLEWWSLSLPWSHWSLSLLCHVSTSLCAETGSIWLSHGGALQFLVTIMSSRETWVVSDSGLLRSLQQSQCQHGSRCWWGDGMVANLVLATADLHALLRDLLLNGGRSCPAPRRLGAPLLGQRGVGVQLGVLHHHAGVLAQIVDMLLLF